jgi:NADPH-dependent ferric siderophore reductase
LRRVPEPGARLRREPPPWRPAVVRAVEPRSPHLVRLTLHGEGLGALDPGLPTSSVRLLVPAPGAALEVPTWNGNEFLDAAGQRPVIRTYTLRALRPERDELDVEVVLHPAGAVAAWAAAAVPGSPLLVSGTGRGYAVDAAGTRWVVAGDEAALPAIAVLLEVLPRAAAVEVHVEVAAPGARVELPAHPGAVVRWWDRPAGAPPGDAVVAAVRGAAIDEATRVWVAGEAAAVQRVRRQLFAERGVARSMTWVRGYWKVGRAGDADDDA